MSWVEEGFMPVYHELTVYLAACHTFVVLHSCASKGQR